MKKSNVTLSLNKKRISTLKTQEISGGVSGRTCEYTNKYYKTCYWNCAFTEADCYTEYCQNTVQVCDH